MQVSGVLHDNSTLHESAQWEFWEKEASQMAAVRKAVLEMGGGGVVQWLIQKE